MCTIVVLYRAHPDHPLIVAANRDEIYAREALPPRRLPDDPRVVAGVDCQHGGTWMGAHASGLFVGITNQRTWRFPDRAPKSRGEVAVAALRTGSREGVRALVEALDPRQYLSFNLIWGDARGVEVAYARHDPPGVEIVSLPEGMHVLANDRMGSPHFPKTRRAAELTRPVRDAAWPDAAERLREALSDHALPPLDEVPAPPPGTLDHALVRELQALCIHTAFYGTRSSTLLAIDDARVARYLFADGPPCVTPYQDLTHLVEP